MSGFNDELCKRIRRVLDYDELTGVFKWKLKISKKIIVGDLAGKPTLDGYVKIRVDKVLYQAHRLAWLYHYGVFPENGIDHINRSKSDNRIINLRDISPSENSHNRDIPSSNVSGYKGISPTGKNRSKWRAYITVEMKREYFGTHDTLEEAIEARKDAEVLCGYDGVYNEWF